MFSLGERNNWGILLAYCFLLDGKIITALIIITLLNILLFKEKRIDYKTCLLFSILLICLYLAFNYFCNLFLDYRYVISLAINNSLLISNLNRVKDEECISWLTLCFGFYLCCIIIPSEILTYAGKLYCFALVSFTFLPLSFIYLLMLYFRQYNKIEVYKHKNDRIK